MESNQTRFITDKELERNLAKVQSALRGIGEESYLSFSRLADTHTEATQRMQENIFRQIKDAELLIETLKKNEKAQDTLISKLREGIVTSQDYADAQAVLCSQQADLKAQIVKVNQELEREIELSLRSASTWEQKVEMMTRFKDAYVLLNASKPVTSSLFGGGYIGEKETGLASVSRSHGNLPDFEQIMALTKLGKSNYYGLLAAGAYEVGKEVVKGNDDLSAGIDMVKAVFKTHAVDLAKRMNAFSSSLGNLFSGDWKAFKENISSAFKFEPKKVFANDVAAATSAYGLAQLEKQVSEHSAQIKENDRQILSYCRSLEKADISLQERERLWKDATGLQRANQAMMANDSMDEYKYGFKIKNKSIYKEIRGLFGNDLFVLEKQARNLYKGKSFSAEDQKVFFDILKQITSTEKIGWNEEAKTQFSTYFSRAFAYNQIHRERVDQINASYTAGETASKQKAEEVFRPRGVVSSYRATSPSPSASDTDPAVPRFDPEPLRAELEEKKRFYQEDLAAYLDYLRKKMEAAGQKDGPDGKQEQKIIGKEIAKTERTQENRLDGLLKQYQGYTAKMTSLTVSYQSEMALLEKAMNEAGTEEEKQRIGEAMDLRSDAYTASLTRLETENAGFSQILFGDLQNISKGALKKAIAEAKAFIKDWKANAGDISPETEQVMKKIEAGIEHATEKTKSDLPADLQEAAAGLRVCADLAYTFDESLGAVIETTAQVAQGAADIAGGIAMISTNPIQGAAGILSGITQIVGGIGKRLQENKRIREEYLQGLVETYSKELEYNSILRERLRIQQQLGETSLDYFGRMESELKKQQGDIDREYKEVWGKLMDEQYISGQGYKHGTWFRKAKTWNEYSSLAGKSYEEIESLYTQDKLEGSAKVLFERLRQLKEEGADVTEMMDQLHEQMKENWTGTTSSAIADSIVQGFLDGKRSAADFADSFQEMMRTAMMQAVKMKYLEGPLNDWYARFAEAAEGGLTEDKIATLRDEYNRIIEDAARQTENLEAITGVSMEGDAAMREAAAKGIASMSQETASELNGNFYALQYLTSNIDRNVTSIQSVLYQASDQWVRIEENTRYCRKLETMEKDMASIRKDMQDINNKGILMRTR